MLGSSVIILLLLLSFIFLFGMTIDAVRHVIEEMFLDGKRWEYFRRSSVKIDDLTARWELDEVAYETEYFYLEFFGNLAVSLAFLLLVIVWKSNFSTGILIFTHAALVIVFFVRPIFSCWKEDQGTGDQQKNEKTDKGKNKKLKKACPFMATILLLVIFIFLAITYLCPSLCPSIHSYLKMSIHELHFLFIGLILISGSLEVYIVRFKRWQNLMKKIWDDPPEGKSLDTDEKLGPVRNISSNQEGRPWHRRIGRRVRIWR